MEAAKFRTFIYEVLFVLCIFTTIVFIKCAGFLNTSDFTVPYKSQAAVNFVSKLKYNEIYFTVARPVHALMVA
eukprot:SAG11_NODE_18702_length_483_cov_1.614583_2_plen_72_part_01